MGKKLYVGSLPYSFSEGQLVELFSQYGDVESGKVISDKYTGQSKGFGFVEMKSDEDAKKAIDALNGTQVEGRKIVVNEARPMESRPPRTDRGGSGGGGRRGGGGDRGNRNSRW